MKIKSTFVIALLAASTLFFPSCGSKVSSEPVSGDGEKTKTSSSSDAVTKEFLAGKTWKAETGHGTAPMSRMTFTENTLNFGSGEEPYFIKDGILDITDFHIKYTITRSGDGYNLTLKDGATFKYTVEGGTSTSEPSTTETKTTETKTAETSSTTTSSSEAKFKIGDKVEVFDAAYEKKWFPSDILKVKDGKYYIHYHGYASKWDVWTSEKNVRTAK